jgi:hypothetical protein
VGRVAFIWDLEDDPEGNYWHVCVEGQGITQEEVEKVLAANYETGSAAAACSLRSLHGSVDLALLRQPGHVSPLGVLLDLS